MDWCKETSQSGSNWTVVLFAFRMKTCFWTDHRKFCRKRKTNRTNRTSCRSSWDAEARLPASWRVSWKNPPHTSTSHRLEPQRETADGAKPTDPITTWQKREPGWRRADGAWEPPRLHPSSQDINNEAGKHSAWVLLDSDQRRIHPHCTEPQTQQTCCSDPTRPKTEMLSHVWCCGKIYY